MENWMHARSWGNDFHIFPFFLIQCNFRKISQAHAPVWMTYTNSPTKYLVPLQRIRCKYVESHSGWAESMVITWCYFFAGRQTKKSCNYHNIYMYHGWLATVGKIETESFHAFEVVVRRTNFKDLSILRVHADNREKTLLLLILLKY